MQLTKIEHASVYGQIISDASMLDCDPAVGIVMVQEENSGEIHPAVVRFEDALPQGTRVLVHRTSITDHERGICGEVYTVLPAQRKNLRRDKESTIGILDDHLANMPIEHPLAA